MPPEALGHLPAFSDLLRVERSVLESDRLEEMFASKVKEGNAGYTLDDDRSEVVEMIVVLCEG